MDIHVKIKDDFIPNFNSHYFADKVLLVNPYGDWLVLNYNEFRKIKINILGTPIELINKLEEKGLIISKNNYNNLIKKNKEKNYFLEGGPSLHIIELTNNCNMYCDYCFANAKIGHKANLNMSKETAKNVMNYIFNSNQKHLTIQFQGGEPIINFEILKYIVKHSKSLSKKKNIKITFQVATNMSLMDREKLEYLIKNKIRITTSFDGPKELHDKNRKLFNNKSSYDIVKKWIKIIRNEYKYPYFLPVPTISKLSLPYWKEIIDEYVNLNLPIIRLRYYFYSGRAKINWNKIGYTSEEFLNFFEKSLDYILKLNKKGIKLKEENITTILKKIYYPYEIDSQRCMCFRRPCGALISQLSYKHNGEIYACDAGRSESFFNLGKVEIPNFNKMTNLKNKLLKKINPQNLTCAKCAWFAFCGECVVSTYGEEHKLDLNPEINFYCKIRKNIIKSLFDKIIYNKNFESLFSEWLHSGPINKVNIDSYENLNVIKSG